MKKRQVTTSIVTTVPRKASGGPQKGGWVKSLKQKLVSVLERTPKPGSGQGVKTQDGGVYVVAKDGGLRRLDKMRGKKKDRMRARKAAKAEKAAKKATV